MIFSYIGLTLFVLSLAVIAPTVYLNEKNKGAGPTKGLLVSVAFIIAGWVFLVIGALG